MIVRRNRKASDTKVTRPLTKSEKQRRLRHELLEERQLLAVGPQLLGIDHNNGVLIQDGSVHNTAPRELTFRFDEAQVLDRATLEAIKLLRSGDDGVFDNGNDIEINPGFLDLGQTSYTVVMRFAETLPDDLYRIDIAGTGADALRNVDGVALGDQTDDGADNGEDFTLSFDLQLGEQVISVVPQPVRRDALSGQLSQAKDQVEVHFNRGDLDVSTVTNPAYYRLIDTEDRSQLFPQSISFDPATKIALLTFPQDLSTATYELQIGETEESNEIASDAVDLGTISQQAVAAVYDSPVRTDVDGNVVATAIPDNGSVISAISVVDSFFIKDVNVEVNIDHEWGPDLRIFLQAPGGQRVELMRDVGSQVRGGQIYGVKYEDLDFDFEQDENEPGLPGWTIFIDDNLNGELDPGERSTVTDAEGRYSFLNLELDQTYRVVEIEQPFFFSIGDLLSDESVATEIFSTDFSDGSTQTLTINGNATDGEFFLGFDGRTTEAIEFVDSTDGVETAANIQAALDAIVDPAVSTIVTATDGKEFVIAFVVAGVGTPIDHPALTVVDNQLNTGSLTMANTGDDSGFTSDGPQDLWHLSSGRSNAPGHTPQWSFYFGQNETEAGGGSYVNNADGTLRSPEIDLTDPALSGPIVLRLNSLVSAEVDFDEATISVLADGQETVIYTSDAENTEFEELELDLFEFAGRVIQLQFNFQSDGSFTNEGWYVDDIRIEMERAHHSVTVGSGPTEQVVGQVDFLGFRVPGTGPDAGGYQAYSIWENFEDITDTGNKILQAFGAPGSVSQLGGAGDQVITDLAEDAAGNTYITGSFQGTVDFDLGAGTSELTSAGGNDIFVAKYDSAGALLWARAGGGTSSDVGTALAIDSADNVIVSGSFSQTANIGGTNLTSSGSTDILIWKLDSAGATVWARGMGSNAIDEATDVDVTSTGDIVATGFFSSTVDFDPGAGTQNQTSSGLTDSFVLKLTSAGNFDWVRRTGGTAADRGEGINITAAGNVVVTGSFTATVDFNPGGGTVNLTSAGAADGYVQQLTASGGFSWAQRFGGALSDRGNDVDSDAAGDVYVTGVSNGDIFIRRLTDAGATTWTQTLGGNSTDIGQAIQVAADGSIAVAGSFREEVNFGAATGTTTSSGGADAFVARLNPLTGQTNNIATFGGAQDDSANGVHIIDPNSFRVAGSFRGTADFDVGTSVEMLTSDGGADAFLARVATVVGVDDEAVELTAADLNGFEFEFYGTTYDSLFVSSNGLITFGGAETSADNTDLLAAPDQATIAVFWEDLQTGSAEVDAVFWEVKGTGDDQRLVVHWNNVRVNTPNVPALDFEAVLYERDGAIHLNYREVTDAQVIPLGPELPVGTFTKGEQLQPEIASDAAGNYVMVWTSQDQDGTAGSIYGRRFDAAGNPLGDEFPIAQDSSGVQRLPRLGMNASGRFVVTWVNESGAEPGDVFARVFNANGTPRTGDFRVHQQTAGTQQDGEVVVDDSGNFIVAWHGAGQDDADGVYFKRFNQNGQPLGTVNEVQRMSFEGPPAVGSTYTLLLGGDETATFAFAGNPNTNARNIRDALRGLASTSNNGISVVALPTADEVQTLKVTGGATMGTFQLSLDGVVSADITFAGATMGAATATNIQTALEALGNVGAGNVTVVQDGASDTDFTITFTGALAGLDQSQLLLAANALDMGDVDLATTTDGSTAGRDYQVTFGGTDGARNQPTLALGQTQGGVTHIEFTTLAEGSNGETLVNNERVDNQRRPRIDQADNGNFVISWGSNLQDGSGEGVYAKRYDASGVAIAEEFDEVQHLTIEGPPAAGAVFSLRVGGQGNPTTGPIVYGGANSGARTAANIQTALRNLAGYADVTVTPTPAVGASDEIQILEIFGNPALPQAGTFRLAHRGLITAPIVFAGNTAANAAVTATNIQDALRALPNTAADQITVTAGPANDDPYLFIISFVGGDGGVNHPALVPTDNQLNQGDLRVITVDDGGIVENEFTVTFGGSAGRQDQPELQLANNTGGVTAVTTVELVKGAGSEFPVNVETAGAQRAGDTIVRADGSFLVTWISEEQDGDSGGIFAKLYDANGDVLREEFQVNSFTQGNQQRPRGGTDAAGNFVLAWRSVDGQDGDLGGIYARRLGADGFPLGDEFQVNTVSAGEQFNADVAVNPDGSFVIGFASEALGGGIQAQHFAADGTPVGTERQVSQFGSRQQAEPTVARNAAGNYVVVWTDLNRDADNSSGVYAQLFDSAGTALTGEFMVNENIAFAQTEPSVAIDDAGNFVIAWTREFQTVEDGQTLSQTDVYARRFDATGAAQGGEFLVNNLFQELFQNSPSVAIDHDSSEFIITWIGNETVVGEAYIKGRLFDASGVAVTDEFRITDDTTTGILSPPQVAMNGSGAFVVGWNDTVPQTSAYLRMYDAAGQPVADAALVDDVTDAASQIDQLNVQVGVDDSGRVAVAWASSDFGLFESSIRGRLFDAAGAPLADSFQISDSPSFDYGSSLDSSLSMEPDGKFTVVWTNNSQGIGVQAQRFGGDGSAVGTNFRIDSFTGDQASPVVSQSPSGEFTVAWLDNATGVYTRSFESDLASVGIKNAGPQNPGEEVLQIWVDGSRTELVGDGFSTRVVQYQAPTGRLFAIDSATNQLLELDSVSGATLASFPLPVAPGADAGLAFAGGTLYYVAGNGSELYQLDPDTGGTATQTALPSVSASGLAGLAMLNGELVLLDATAGEMIFMDPFREIELRRVTPAVPVVGGLVGGGARGSLFAFDASGQILELAADGSVLNTLASPGANLSGLALVDGVLLASDNAGSVYQVDPDSGAVAGTLPVATGLSALGADGGGALSAALGGNYQPFVDTIFDDEAGISITEGVGPYTGRYVPIEPLATFDQTNARGAWRLEVVDTQSGNTGVLHSWSLLLNEQQDTPADASRNGFIGDGTDMSVAAADDVDIYRFDITVGGTIQVDVLPADGLDAAIRLFDSAGNELVSVDAAGIDGAEQLIHVAVDAGVYFVGVSSTGNTAYNVVDGSGAAGGTTSGSYGMDIRFSEPVVQDDDNSSFDTATAIGAIGVGGQSIRAEIRSEPYGVELPGSNDEPGHRHIPPETHLNASGGHKHDIEQLIVSFNEGVGAQQQTDLLLNNGLEIVKRFDFIDAVVVRPRDGSEALLKVDALRNLPQVKYAEADGFSEFAAIPNDPQFPQQWHYDNQGQTGGTVDADIDLPEAWDLFTGSAQTVIAVLDSGVDYTHPDLIANMWVNTGEIAGDGIDNDGNGYIDDIHGIDPGEGDSDPMDNNGHGTHVAGTTAAVGDNSVGVTGVNWNSKIMALKVGTAFGGIPDSAVIEALNYIVTMKTVYGVNIVVSNNSYGGAGFSTATQDAIQASIDAGVPFVAAAGNFSIDNDANPFYPASYALDGIISVAASDHNDQLAGFSHFGATSVDLAAPGVDILSTTLGGGYGLNTGTSMASPHVAGVVALMAGYQPDASVSDLKSALMLGADVLPNMTGTTVSGARMNAFQSMQLLEAGVSGPSGQSVLTAFYNFQDVYGQLPSGSVAVNAITENQKDRAREIFEFYGNLTGIEFIETDNEGLTVVTGDLRVLSPTVPTGPGGVAGISDGSLAGLVIMDAAENWGDSEYGGGWFQTAMHEIGHSMGLGHTYDLPALTIMGSFGTGEPVFPGDHDIVHAQHLHKPAAIDQDLYQFTLNGDGMLTAETIAERLAPNASRLDSVLTLYRETGPGTRELVARNDDYYSNDSQLSLHLTRGTYYISVSAANNDNMDPTISDTGFGGTSEGDYELNLSFVPDMAPSIIDTDGVALDGDADGTPGGTFSFFFEAGPTIFVDKMADTGPGVQGDGSLAAPLDNILSATELARSTLVMPRDGASQLVDGESFVISDGLNSPVRFEFDDNEFVTPDSIAVPFTADMDGAQLAAAVAAAIESTTTSDPVLLDVDASVDGSQVRIGGTTLVDASGSASLMQSPSLIRIVGNGGSDNDPSTLANNRPYVLGLDGVNQLPDGASLEVPQGVTVMIDAGSLFKMNQANIDVGTSTESVDRSSGALQVLGTPDNVVSFYSYRNDAVGGDSDGPGPAASPGDWGGLVFRADSDMEDHGIFLSRVNHAEIVSGGGKLLVESVEETFTPIHMLGARPTVSHNTIRRSADAAISADPAAFEESLGRVGPDIHDNLVINNSINGLFINVATEVGSAIDRISLPSRWDDTDITHVLTENLLIAATPGGPRKDAATGIINARLDGSLKIDPGIIVKLEGSRIETLLGAQLIAEGNETADVVFTALTDDSYGGSGSFDTKNDGDATGPQAGQWGGLFFAAMAEGSLDHVMLAYGGGQTPIEGGFDQFNAIEIHQADVRITNSVIRDTAAGTSSSGRNGRGTNAAATVFVRGAQPIIVDNLFQDNVGTVIHINANSLQAVRHTDYGRRTGELDRFEQFDSNYGPLIRLNRLENNSFNGMEVRGAVLTTESVWDDTDIAHILRGEIEVLNHHTYSGLHLLSTDSQSLVIKLSGPDAGFTANGTLLDIDDRIGGSIYIGERGLPVILTSLADDTAIAGVDGQGLPLGDVDNNGGSAGAPGDWRGITLDRYSNDRNVALWREVEPAFSGLDDLNRVPEDAEFLGNLAPDDKSGDVNRRLGFEVHGNISVDNRSDVDVYSFSGVAGTEVYFDLDQTSHSLDSILELIDATGTVLARSENAEAINLSGSALPLLKVNYLGHDFYSTSERDAGMRVVLPGTPGRTGTYFVRVRSNPVEGDVENINGGQSRGEYKLQIRLRQVDEKPGSFIRNADIRYATNGIEVIGLPSHSPLIGESYETRAGNDSLNAAQPLGNLLTTDRNTLSVGGTIDSPTDVDWYEFELDYDLIQAIGGFNTGGKTFSTIFDIDYADGLSRPDTVLSVFDASGNLVLVSRDSNVEDDQPGAGQGADIEDLSRGSFGTQDAFIGSVQMPAGVKPAGSTTTYYVAVSSNSELPTALNGTFTSGAGNTLVRLEPVNSLQRIAEDHIGFQGYISGSANGATIVEPTYELFDISNSVSLSANVVEYTLKDVILYTIQPGTNGLKAVNPYTGNQWHNVGNVPTNNPGRLVGDLQMRSDGRLFMVESLFGQAGQNTAGRLVELNPEDGSATVVGTDSIPDINAQANPPVADELTSPGIEAFSWRRRGINGGVTEYDLYYAVIGGRRGPGVDTSSSTLYRADPANGSAAPQQGQPWGVRGEIFQNQPGDLGRTTGMAFVDNTLYGVSDQGYFYEIDLGSGRATNVVSLGLDFTSLALGPQNAEGGRFADMLFASDATGGLYAMDTSGNLQSVFIGGTTAATPTSPVGIAFSALDFNLWHPTERRGTDAGHGINRTFDQSRTDTFELGLGSDSDVRDVSDDEGGLSFYFGLETWENNPDSAEAYLNYNGVNAQYGVLSENSHRDLTNNPIIGDNFNLPGGAMGSLQTNNFSLAGYEQADKPTLYFNYFLATEGRDANNQMRDSARVLVSNDGGNSWELLATNNSVLSPIGGVYELPSFISPSIEASTHPRQQVQELFDNTGGWRQARVDLSNYAGDADLQFRFDFSTAGGMVGDDGFAQFGDPSTFNSLNRVERGRDNNHEGFYVDDIIVGFAERGEMVTNSPAQSGFFSIPENPNAGDPSQVLVGDYQLEIRRGTEYGENVDSVNPDIIVYQTFDTNDRLIPALFRLGDSNLYREQGQVLIANNSISDSLEYGIVVDAGARDAGGSLSHPGGVRNLPTINNERLTAGVKVENNIVDTFGQGGILFSGDPNTGTQPLASVPFGRIMNNTVYGGETASGQGIEITQNASPTVLNNVIANTAAGLTVDASSSTTVLGANLFQGNTSNGNIGENAIVLAAGAPLFVDAINGNFYPAPGSLAVDSSLNSLVDRPNFEAVNSPLGIPTSPILAPERDRFGQLRLDDPAQDPPPGLGANIFKDRGAVERADFRGPSSRLIDPLDNDGLGVDLNPLPNEVLVEAPIIDQIVIQLLDQGIGIDDSSVTVGQIELYLDDVLLTEGTDYEFIYNATNNQIVLRALKNNGPVSNRYEVRLSNGGPDGIRDLADNSLAPNEGTGLTRYIIVTDGNAGSGMLPDFTLAATEVNALEDNELEVGATPTSIPNFATDLPMPGLGDPAVVMVTDSVSDPGLFTVQPAIDASGTLTFVTAPDQNGSAEIVVYLTETGVPNPNLSNPQTFTISLAPVNDAPFLSVPDVANALEDAGLVTIPNFAAGFGPGPVTATDEVDQVVTVTTTALTPAAFVTLPQIDNNGTLTFQTTPDYNSSMGELLVTVSAVDDGPSDAPNVNQSEVRTFTINIDAVNDPPSFTLSTSRVSVPEDTSGSFPNFAGNETVGPPTATDEVGQTTSYELIAATPELFSIQPSIDDNGQLTFTPAPNRSGETVVFVQLIDSGSGVSPNNNRSATASFTVSIEPVNDPPEFTIPTTISSAEDAGPQVVNGFATNIRTGPEGATDETSQSLNFTVTAFSPAAFAIQPTINNEGVLSFQSAPNANSTNADFRVTVQLFDSGPDSPPPNDNSSGIQVFDIVVDPVNDAPVTDAFVVIGTEDTPVDISAADVLAGDLPGPTPDEFNQSLRMTLAEQSTSAGGSVTVLREDSTDPTRITGLQYQPPLDFVGTDTFLYVVTDDGVPTRSATGTISVAIQGINDAPQFTRGDDVQILEDSGEYIGTAWATDIAAGPPSATDELTGQSVSFEVTAGDPALFAVQPTVDGNGNLRLTPAVDANGSTTVTVRAVDSGSGVAPNVNASPFQTFTVTIDAVNDAPEFTVGADVTVAEDSEAYSAGWATSIAPAAGLLNSPPTATDEASQSVSFTVAVDKPELFEVDPAIDSEGNLTFTPQADASGQAIVTVTLFDDGSATTPNVNLSETKSFTITIAGENDAPVAVSDRYATDEDSLLSIAAAGVLTNDTDTDLPSDTLQAVAGTFTSSMGADVVLNADGSFTYDATSVPEFQALQSGNSVFDTFTYRAVDASGTESADATVTIEVNGVDDAPVANDDAFSIAAGQSAELAILQNDTDIDSLIDTSSIEIEANPAFGTLEVLASGLVRYIPDPGFRGADAFSYTVRDTAGNLSNEADVAVTVNSAPNAGPDNAITYKNTSIDIEVLANDSDADGTIDADSVLISGQSANGTAEVLDGGVIRFTPATDFVGRTEFTYTVNDNVGTTSNSATVTVDVLNSRWQNPGENLDVNADGFISPIDALIIINYLNSGGETFLPDSGLEAPPFVDVNGDENISPLDALVIINHLNASVGSAEGEAAGELFTSVMVEQVPPVQVLQAANRVSVIDESDEALQSILESDLEPMSPVYGPLPNMADAMQDDEEFIEMLSCSRDEDSTPDGEDGIDAFFGGIGPQLPE